MRYHCIAVFTYVSYAICSTELASGSRRLERSSYVIPNLGAKCFVGEGTLHSDGSQAACAPYITVGHDLTGCEGDLCGKPICCPPETEQEIDLDDCSWRGSVEDCHGQCITGHVKLARSTWDESAGMKIAKNACKSGSTALCCGLRSYKKMFADCYHTPGFGYPCTHDYISIAHFWNPWVPWKKGHPVYDPGEDLCCLISSPLPFINCHWVGEGDCLDANCAASEVSLGIDGFGGDGESCIGARSKSLCCTPNLAVLDRMMSPDEPEDIVMCKSSDDCLGGTCHDGICHFDTGIEERATNYPPRCSSNKECGQNKRCWGGFCKFHYVYQGWRKRDTGSIERDVDVLAAKPPDHCAVNSHCPRNQRCYGGVCKYRPPHNSPPRRDDEDITVVERDVEGLTGKYPPRCKSKNDCPPNNRYYGGICKYRPPHPMKRDDEDVAISERDFVALPGTFDPNCKTKSDCPPWYQCRKNICKYCPPTKRDDDDDNLGDDEHQVDE